MEIKKGDLVMVVKPSECCGSDESIGVMFVVSEVKTTKSRCIYCRKVRMFDAAFKSNKLCCMISRLKKIKPLDELEREEKSVEVTA